MAELTFPIDQQGVARGARFTDRGCISCPTGSAFSSDEALGTLERVTNKVLLEGWKDIQVPQFPLAGLPVRAASFQQMTRISKVKHVAGYSRVHRLPWYDPTPELAQFHVTGELIEKCGGNLALATMLGNTNSIGCAPPIGPTGFTGKRRFYQSAFFSTLALGPICVTNYLDHQDFRGAMEAYQKACLRGASMALEYEKIRRYIDMSPKNASAVAGTRRPRFASSNFADIPNSPGSFEWLIEAVETGLGGEIRSDQAINVKVSQQVLEYWVKKYVADNSNDINLQAQIDWANLRVAAQGYQGQFADGVFKLVSKRTNRRINVMVDNMTPVYTEVKTTGSGTAEWDFQDYYSQELGNDPEDLQGSGIWQSLNTSYGDAEMCEGEAKTLAELILVWVDGAFHYENFPTNPLGWAMKGVETNLQNLWNATNLRWYMGCEVDLYFLNKINEQLQGTGAPCFSNRQNTWFAAELTMGLQMVEDEPRQMMALLVAVPTSGSPLESCETLLPVTSAAAITLAPAPARTEPPLCQVFDADAEPTEATAGCFQPPEEIKFLLPESGNRSVTVTFQRVGGVTGTLTVPYTITEDTATEGTAGTDHFRLAAGNIVFADGEATKDVTIVLHPIAREDGDPVWVSATIDYDNDPEVICEGGFTSTTISLKLFEA